MRSAALLFTLLLRCAATPAPLAKPIELPRSPPPEVTETVHTLEPHVGAGACDIGGASLGVSYPVELCGAPHRACFGRVSDGASTTRRALRIAPPRDVLFAYVRAGVVVSAVIDGQHIAAHLATPQLVDFFVPSSAAMTITAVGAGRISLAVDPGSDVQLNHLLDLETTCTELTTDAPAVGFDEAERAAHLGTRRGFANIISPAPVALRATSAGPIVGVLIANGQLATVHHRAAQRTQVVIRVAEGFAVVWVDDDVVIATTSGSHRTRTPTIRTQVMHTGLTCPHPVDVIADVASDRVHAATIEEGTRFEPAHIDETIRLAGVDAINGATFRVEPSDIADCTRE